MHPKNDFILEICLPFSQLVSLTQFSIFFASTLSASQKTQPHIYTQVRYVDDFTLTLFELNMPSSAWRLLLLPDMVPLMVLSGRIPVWFVCEFGSALLEAVEFIVFVSDSRLRSSNGMSSGGTNPDLYLSITISVSCQRNIETISAENIILTMHEYQKNINNYDFQVLEKNRGDTRRNLAEKIIYVYDHISSRMHQSVIFWNPAQYPDISDFVLTFVKIEYVD